MLGDAGAPNDDGSYTGDTGDSVFDVQYYRNKAREFQVVMDQLDRTAGIARQLVGLDLNPQSTADAQAFLDEFESKKYQFRWAAEAINASAAVFNSAGGRFPQLSIPNGLGAVPLAVPVAVIAAIGAASALVAWGYAAIQGYNARLRDQSIMESLTPEQKGGYAALVAQSDAALAAADNPLSAVAGGVKWLAIAAVAFFAYRAFSEYKQNPIFGGLLDDEGEDDEKGFLSVSDDD